MQPKFISKRKILSIPLSLVHIPNPPHYGYGTTRDENGISYSGHFKNGKENGFGIYRFPSGEKFVGYFKNGQAEGMGIATTPNGDISRSIYKDGEIHANLSINMTDGLSVNFINQSITGNRQSLFAAKLNRSDYPSVPMEAGVGICSVLEMFTIKPYEFAPNVERVIRTTRNALDTVVRLTFLEESLEPFFKKSLISPQLLLVESSEHGEYFVLYQNTLYLCDTPGSRPDGLWAPTVTKIKFEKTSEMEAYLRHFYKLSRDDNPDYTEVKKSKIQRIETRSSELDQLNALLPLQNTRNCWFMNARAAATVILKIVSDQVGVKFRPLYDRYLSTTAVVKLELDKWVQYQETLNPDYKPYKDSTIRNLLQNDLSLYLYFVNQGHEKIPSENYFFKGRYKPTSPVN